jgi:hypothetical protein
VLPRLMAACVTPVRAISCERAKKQSVLPKPRARASAEHLKPLVATSVTPIRANSCVRAEQQPVLPKKRAKQ